MIKKCSKLLLAIVFVFVTFLVSVNIVNAAEVTLDQFAELIKEHNEETTYVYLIGEYAFTSERLLTTQDVMLAARSIEVSENSGDIDTDPVYNEMTIAYFKGVYDADWNLTGLELKDNIVGTTKLGSTFNVRYIDYNEYVAEVDVDTLVNKAYETIKGEAATDKFIISKEGTTIGIKLNDLEMNSIDALAGTGIATAAIDFLKEAGIEAVTLTYGNEKVTISDTVDTKAVEAFFKTMGTKSGDLVGKTISAELTFADGYKTANSSKFEIAFSQVVSIDVDALVNKAYETIKGQAATDKFIAKLNGTEIEVMLVDLTMSSVDALMGTGVHTAVINFLEETGIEKVTLTSGNAKLDVSKDSIDAKEIENFLKEIGEDAAGLVGKEIKAEVAFEEGYKTANSDEFTIKITEQEKVDVDALVEKAYAVVESQAAKDKFIAKLNGTEVEIMLVDLTMNSVDALVGTGVATAVVDFLEETGIEKVTLTSGDAKLEVTKTNLDADAVETFLKEIGKDAAALVGKEIKAEIAFAEGYKTANSDSFTIKITEQTKVDVDALVNKAYATIDGQESDKFAVSVEGTNVKVMLADLTMSSVDALMGTGVHTAAINFLKEEGIKSVTLTSGDAKLEITSENLDATAVENFFKALGTNAGDLVGKTITAKVAFDDEYKTANSDSFLVTFEEAKGVDVDSLVKTAYGVIEAQAAKDKFIPVLKGTRIGIILVDLEMNSVDALMGTGVQTAVTNFLKAEGIESVTLGYGDAKLEVSADSIDAKEIENFLKTMGTKASDLIGKAITAKVDFEFGYTTTNSSEFTIEFVEQEKVDVDALVEKAYATIDSQAAEDKFLVNIDEDITVLLVDQTMNSIDALMGTGVQTAVLDFLKETGIKSVVLASGNVQLEVTKDNLDATAVENFLKTIGTSAKDLVGKQIQAYVLFEDGFKTANSNEFAINFIQKETVDVDALVNKAYTTISNQADKDKIVAKLNGTEIEVVLVDTTMNSVDALAGTGVATAITNFLKEEGIEKVTLTYGNAKLDVSKDNIDADAIEAFLKEIGTDAAALIGKEIKAVVDFEFGYETANSSEFTIKVSEAEKVAVETLVEKAYGVIEKQAATDVFVAKLNGTEIKVILVDQTMDSVDALMGTGVSTAATNLLKEEGVEKVTLYCEGAELALSGDSIDADQVETFLKKLGTKASDLIGKTITVVVDFEAGYKAANSDEFTIEICDTEKVDVKTAVNTAFGEVSENDVFEATVNEDKIQVVLKDLKADSVSTLAGSGIGKAALSLLNQEGVKEVGLAYSGYEISFTKDNLNANQVDAFFKNIGSTTKDLLNKNILVGVLFEAGYEAKDINSFVVSFTEKEYEVKYEVDGTEYKTDLVKVGSTATAPEAPTKEGYTFDKWLLNGTAYDFTTEIEGPITLVASWTINQYKVSIVSEDISKGKVSVDAVTVDYGTEVKVSNNSVTIGNQTIVATPNAATAQYTFAFASWENATSPVKGAMTITAKFSSTVNKYTVTYVDSSANTLGTEVVDYGTEVSKLTAPKKDGYVATGYLKDSVEVKDTDTISGTTTLEVVYAIEFDVDTTLATSLASIEATYYEAELVDNDVIANFTDPDLKFSNFTFMGEVLDLLDSLTSNDKYQSVKLSYDDNPDHQVEIKGDVNALNVARFIGLVTTGQWSGSNGSNATVAQLVEATAKKPITVTVTLVDGYADPTGEVAPLYDLIFTCNQ